MVRASVIMVSYHTGAVLFHAIDSVLAQAGLAELIVVDNGNPPEVLERLRGMPLTLITGHGNIGFSKACNLGARKASGDYVLLLNPDCLVQPGAIAALCGALQQHPTAMMAGPLLQNPDGSEQRGGRRQLLTPLTAISEGLGLHRLMKVRRLNDNETTTPSTTCEVPAISGACMCLKRESFERLGMDEHYFLHVEDMDLCFRIYAAGGKILFVPEARVVHLLSTSDAPSPFIEWCKAKGFMHYFHTHFRHYPKTLLWPADLAIIIRFVLKTLFRRSTKSAHAALAGKKILLLLEAKQKPAPHDLRGRAVAVIGPGSLTGMIAIGRLLAAGASVCGVSRQPPLPVAIEGLSWQRRDINDPQYALESRADIAVSCAPLWAMPQALPALARGGVKKLVAFGSTSLFGKVDSKNSMEQGVVSRLREAETLIAVQCSALGMHYTILRPTLIYGTGMDGNVGRIARNIRCFGCFPIVPPATGLRQPVHADDLALAVVAVAASGAATDKAYNMGGGETLSYRAMVERIFRTFGKTPRLLPLPVLPLLLDVAGRLLHKSILNGEMAERMNIDLAFSYEGAAQDFGYAPRPFLSGGMADIMGPR